MFCGVEVTSGLCVGVNRVNATEEALEETRLQQNWSHPCVCEFLSSFSGSVHLYVVMELCRVRDLFDLIGDRRDACFPKLETQEYMDKMLLYQSGLASARSWVRTYVYPMRVDFTFRLIGLKGPVGHYCKIYF